MNVLTEAVIIEAECLTEEATTAVTLMAVAEAIITAVTDHLNRVTTARVTREGPAQPRNIATTSDAETTNDPMHRQIENVIDTHPHLNHGSNRSNWKSVLVFGCVSEELTRLGRLS